jgi:soluble P-type ATPase
MKLDIPGYGILEIHHIVLDLNGTLATDGVIPQTVTAKIAELSKYFRVVVTSSDTYGNLQELADHLGIEAYSLKSNDASDEKRDLISFIGAQHTIAIGNGYNDAKMLKEAAIGICVIGKEGANRKALENADIIVTSIEDALDCILKPKRIIANLRNA